MKLMNKSAICLAIFLSITGCDNDTGSSALKDAIESTKDAASNAVEATSDTANEVKQAAVDGADATLDTADEMASDIKDVAEKAGEALGDTIGDATEIVAKDVDSIVIGEATESADNVSEAISGEAEPVNDVSKEADSAVMAKPIELTESPKAVSGTAEAVESSKDTLAETPENANDRAPKVVDNVEDNTQMLKDKASMELEGEIE